MENTLAELRPAVRLFVHFPNGCYPESINVEWDHGTETPELDELAALIDALKPRKATRLTGMLTDMLENNLGAFLVRGKPCDNPDCTSCRTAEQASAETDVPGDTDPADADEASSADQAASDADTAEKPADSEPVPASSWGGFTG